MKSPKYCNQCKWSLETTDNYSLMCTHPKVNAADSWQLGRKEITGGKECHYAREKRLFAPCGLKGKLWVEV